MVSNVSLEVEKGQTLVLLGKSGSGKTTLLKMINRMVDIDSGSIWIDHQPISGLPLETLRRNIGYVIQAVGLFPHWTVEENIGTVPRLLGWSGPATNKRTGELLEQMGLPASLRKRYPHQLSGGQQQRVGVARALAANPALLLMDEPFGALDPVTRKDIQSDFQSLDVLKNLTKVIVTHDVREAFLLGDQIALIHRGKVVEKGPPTDLLTKADSPITREFLAGERWQLIANLTTIADILAYTTLETHQPAAPTATFDITTAHVSNVLDGHDGHIQLTDGGRVLGYVSAFDLQLAFLNYSNPQPGK